MSDILPEHVIIAESSVKYALSKMKENRIIEELIFTHSGNCDNEILIINNLIAEGFTIHNIVFIDLPGEYDDKIDYQNSIISRIDIPIENVKVEFTDFYLFLDKYIKLPNKSFSPENTICITNQPAYSNCYNDPSTMGYRIAEFYDFILQKVRDFIIFNYTSARIIEKTETETYFNSGINDLDVKRFDKIDCDSYYEAFLTLTGDDSNKKQRYENSLKTGPKPEPTAAELKQFREKRGPAVRFMYNDDRVVQTEYGGKKIKKLKKTSRNKRKGKTTKKRRRKH